MIVMAKVAWNLGLDHKFHDDISRGKRCFLRTVGCYGPDEVLLNSSSVATVTRPDAGQSGTLGYS